MTPGDATPSCRPLLAAIIAALSLTFFILACFWSASLWTGPTPRDATFPALLWFWAGAACLGVGLVVLIYIAAPKRRATWRTAAVILMLALLARVAVSLIPGPRLSDDLYRYVHDGATLASGHNPYAHAPAEITPASAPVPAVLARINHPKLVTIYQPAAQYVFGVVDRLYQLTPRAWQRFDPERTHTFRLAFSLFDLALIALLLLALIRAGHSPWWACLYALHPLAIAEVAWSGHEDILGILPMVAAMMLVTSSPRSRTNRLLAAFFFALAVAVKPIMLPLALDLAWPFRRDLRRLLAPAVTCVATLAALYLPFAFMPAGLTRLFATARQFAWNWQFNPSLHALIASVLGVPIAHSLALLLPLALMLAVLYRTACLYQAALGYLLALLLLASTVYPWYLLWPLALLPMTRSPAMLAFSFTVLLSYISLTNPRSFAVPLPWRFVEYAPVLLLLIPAAWRFTSQRSVSPIATDHGT